MSRYEHGRILAVNETKLGSELVAAHAAGVLSLTVEDPVDFDEDGGHLLIADQVIEYETYDDDTGEITLLSALEAAAGDGERVWLYDPLYQTITTDLIAEVELDGDDDNTDALECSIAHHLVDKVSEGIRGLRGESVRLEQDGDEWIIVDILGLSDKGATGTQFWQDHHTVAAAGTQTIALTHEPITNSEHLYWNGLYQPAGEWTRSGQAITVPDSGGHLVVGDELVVEYAYRAGAAPPARIFIDYGSTGWSYMQVASTDTVDRSAPSYDDSTWSVAAAPFGNVPNGHTTQPWPGTVTNWAANTDLWIRRDIALTPGAPVSVRVRVDNTAKIYWNGTLIGETGDVVETQDFPVDTGLVAANNTLAVRGHDYGDVTYLDIRIEAL